MNNPQGFPISGMPSRRSAWRTMALLALVLSASHFLVFGIARLLIATREPYVFAEAVLRVSTPADLVASIVATPAFLESIQDPEWTPFLDAALSERNDGPVRDSVRGSFLFRHLTMEVKGRIDDGMILAIKVILPYELCKQYPHGSLPACIANSIAREYRKSFDQILEAVVEYNRKPLRKELDLLSGPDRRLSDSTPPREEELLSRLSRFRNMGTLDAETVRIERLADQAAFPKLHVENASARPLTLLLGNVLGIVAYAILVSRKRFPDH